MREWSKRIERLRGQKRAEEASKSSDYGNRQRALDQYIEALDMLKADDSGSEADTARIEDIKERIRELGGDVAERG